MNETNTTYPLTNLLPIGSAICITFVSSYEDRLMVGDVGTITDHDNYDSERPYMIKVDGKGMAWGNGLAIELAKVVVNASEFAELNLSFAQGVQLFKVLQKNNVDINFDA